MRELFPGTVLRTMERSDLDAVCDVEAACRVQGQPLCSRSIFAARLEWPGVYNFVVEQGKDIVGFCVLSIVREQADFLKLALSVRGAPLSPRVVAAIKEEMREQGVKSIVGRCPAELVKFYERLGCIACGTIPHFFGAGKHATALRAKI